MRVRKHETKIGKTFARDEEDTWAQSGGRKDLADGREREGLVTSGKIFLDQFSVSIQGCSWNLGFAIAWSCS